jgi:hypothetical protein
MTLLSQPRFIATGRKDAKEMRKRTADNADVRMAYPRHLRYPRFAFFLLGALGELGGESGFECGAMKRKPTTTR